MSCTSSNKLDIFQWFTSKKPYAVPQCANPYYNVWRCIYLVCLKPHTGRLPQFYCQELYGNVTCYKQIQYTKLNTDLAVCMLFLRYLDYFNFALIMLV